MKGGTAGISTTHPHVMRGLAPLFVALVIVVKGTFYAIRPVEVQEGTCHVDAVLEKGRRNPMSVEHDGVSI